MLFNPESRDKVFLGRRSHEGPPAETHMELVAGHILEEEDSQSGGFVRMEMKVELRAFSPPLQTMGLTPKEARMQ